MSMFGGFFGRLFGSDKAVEALINHTAAGLDKLVYTSEEEADSVRQDRSEARQMVVAWLNNTQGQNLARRVLAFMISGVWLIQYAVAAMLSIAAVWVGPETSEKLMLSVDVLSENAVQMNGAMMLLLGFYFAAPHLDKIVGPALGMFATGKQK